MVLRPTNPRLANLYVQVLGPAGLASVEAQSFARRARSTGLGGLVAASAAHGPKDCSHTIAIETTPVTTSSLQKFSGKQITIAIYGKSNLAPAVCSGLAADRSDVLIGGNRQIYKIPSSAMEPTLHCKGSLGCLGSVDDLVVARLTGAANIRRRDIAVFTAPREASLKCGEGGILVKRVIGLPGETVHEDGNGVIDINGKQLAEPYISPQQRLADSAHFGETWHVPPGGYFMLGDNRSLSCDSRAWGAVPARDVIGPVVEVVRAGRALRPAGTP
ncbi:MAG TPA: signal peptidase I [Thermoanaerobaculia bacterium]|nr:signal peptidase I [Thermoanaerobaculia bacterium]